jgi:hypothetical protein
MFLTRTVLGSFTFSDSLNMGTLLKKIDNRTLKMEKYTIIHSVLKNKLDL